MQGIVVRWLIGSLSLMLVSYLVPGIHIQSFFYAVVGAAALGILNAFLRPILIILTLPLTIFTLGFFLLVINGLMLWMLSGLFRGIEITSFWSAFFGAILLSIIGWFTNSINERGRWEYIEMRKGPDGRWK